LGRAGKHGVTSRFSKYSSGKRVRIETVEKGGEKAKRRKGTDRPMRPRTNGF